ncbi:BNR-containing protein [Organic Lake phycodnavirus 2]|nr:BNR-containing protein [Organic Lake phycodnavirus 2]
MSIIDSSFGEVNSTLSVIDSSFGEVNSALSIIDSSFGEVNSALSVIDTSFGEVNSALSVIDSSFGEVNSALSIIDSSFGEVNSTLSVIDSSFSEVNSTLSVIDTSFGEVNSALSIIDSSFGEVNSALSIIDSSFGEVNTTLSVIDTSFSEVNSTLSVIDSSFGEVNSALSIIDSSFGEVNSALSVIDTSFSEVNSTLSVIDSSFGEVNSALSVIDSSLQSINTQFLQKQDVITDQTNLNVGRLTVNNSIISKEIKQIGGDIFTPTGMTMNRFGTSLSMNSSGDIIAVGAPYEKGENNENYAGSASVFKYENGSWNTLGQLIRGAGGGDRLGAGTACSLNSDGTILAVGSWFHDQSRGHTRVYEYNGTSWVQLGSDIDGINTGDNNGWSISINDSGYIIAIGSCSSDYHTGHTQVYEYDGTSWIQKGQLIDGKYVYGRSGFSVSINSTGNIVAIGAYLGDGNGNGSGLTQIYKYDEVASSWNQLGNDIDGENAGDWSGFLVSINSTGNIVAIGAPKNSDNGTNSSHVRIYRYDGTSWIKLGQDIDGDGVGDNAHYVSINSSGTIVAIGSEENDNNGNNYGHVRVYEYNENNDVWILEFEINGRIDNDKFGKNVVINSEGTIISAVNNKGFNNDVRVYELKNDNIITLLDTKQKSLNNTIDVSINNLTLDNNLHVKGNISLDGSFNLNDVIFNNTTVNNEIVISTQLDISNQGTGPALKVSQFGNGDNNSVALFNAGSEGDALLIDSSGEVTIYKDMFVEGTIRTENIVMSSDRRLKTNIEDISGIDNIRKLQPKQYIKYNKKEIGFIANDILDIEDISFVVSKSSEYYALNYNSLFTLAIQSIKDLDEELKKRTIHLKKDWKS